MTATTNSPSDPHSLGDNLRALRAKWGWIVALGVIFMIAGVIALGSVVMGALYVAAGVVAIERPLMAAAVLTLLLGIALMVGGIGRIFLAWHMREAGKPWGWVVVSGIISLLLGLMIVAKWPYSSVYVLGIFLGIDLIFIGSSWFTIGLALKRRHAV